MLELKSNGLRAVFSPIGARLMALEVDGVDVIVGNAFNFDPFKDDGSAGIVCGRVAGRISNAQYVLDGVTYKLIPNRGSVQLHGGPHNFGNSQWSANKKGSAMRFDIRSPDGDQGHPGAVEASATYQLKGKVLSLDIVATTTKPTMLNVTNHAYWNLAGPKAGRDSAFDLEAQINASHYLPLSGDLLPTGDIAAVQGTKYDFRKLRKVGEVYDNCFCLEGGRGKLKQALTLRDPGSGRRMEVWTTEAGVQFYTASHWDNTVKGKHGNLQQHQAIAIEPQNYPDAPNHANFPSAIVRPGQTYRNHIEWHFS